MHETTILCTLVQSFSLNTHCLSLFPPCSSNLYRMDR
ncbi:hypothetical protein V3C99_012398 [Haemonchus contortus]